jgi:hypothetical protein
MCLFVVVLNFRPEQMKNAEAAEQGNTNGNIQGGGHVVEKDGFTYYTNFNDNDHLYKRSADGATDERMGGITYAYDINVVGCTVYYLAGFPGRIYAVKTDGSGLRLLEFRKCNDLIAAGDMLFYIVWKGGRSHLYRLNTVSGRKRLLIKDVREFAIDKGLIYFSHVIEHPPDDRLESLPQGKFALCRMDMNGDNYVRLNGDCPDSINITNDSIYYTDNLDRDKLCRIDKDGTNKEILSPDECFALVSTEDFIFYSKRGAEKTGIWRMRLDGSEETRIMEGHTEVSDIVGDYMIFRSGQGTAHAYLKSDLNGDGIEAWP